MDDKFIAPKSDTEETKPFIAPATDIEGGEKKNSESQSSSPITEDGSGSETLSTGKIKRSNAQAVEFGNSQVLKKRMAEALSANQSPAYRKVFLDTLEKKGYDRQQMEAFADKISSLEQMKQERSDAAGQAVVDKYDTRLNTGVPVVDDYLNEQGELIEHGVNKMGKALENITRNIAYVPGDEPKTATTKILDLGKDVTKLGAGALSAGFGVASSTVPIVIGFNALLKGANALPEDVKAKYLMFNNPGKSNKELAEDFDKTIELPFTWAGRVAELAGYTPEQGGFGEDAIELLNFVGIPLALKAMGGKSQIKSVEDLNTFYDKMTKGEATEMELKDYQEFTKQLQNLSVEDVKVEAERALDEMPIKDNDIHEKLAALEVDQAKLPEQDKALLQPQIDAIKNEISKKNEAEVVASTEEARNEATVFDINDQILGLEAKKEGLSEVGQEAIQSTIDQLTEQRDQIQAQLPKREPVDTKKQASIMFAPFYDFTVKGVEDAAAVKKSPAYQQYKENIGVIAEQLGVKVLGMDETIGGFKNKEGNKITEVSTKLDLEVDSFEQAEEMAAMMGVLGPEMQESSIAAQHVKAGEATHNADLRELEIDNIDKTIEALNEAGFDNYSINESKGTVTIIDLLEMPDLELKDKYVKFVNALKEKGVTYGQYSERPTRSSYIDSNKREQIFENMERTYGARYDSGRKPGGEMLRDAIQEAKLKNERFRASEALEQERSEYASLREKQLSLQDEGIDLSQTELDRMDELHKVLAPELEKAIKSEEKNYNQAKQEIEALATEAVGEKGFNLPFGLKKADRAAIKILDWYQGKANKLGDGARTNIIVNDLKHADEIFEVIKKNYEGGIMREERGTTEFGYPKRLMEVRTKNGRVAEFQVMEPLAYIAKDGIKDFTPEKREFAIRELQSLREKIGENIPDGAGHWFYEIGRDKKVQPEIRKAAEDISKTYYEAFINPEKYLEGPREFQQKLKAFNEMVENADRSKWAKDHLKNKPTSVDNAFDQVGPPPTQPPVTKNEIKVTGPKREKGVLGSLAKRSELTEPVKKAIENKTLEYEQYSNKDALSVADGIIAEFKEKDGDAWVDKAVDYASVKQEGVPLSINAMVLGKVIAHFGELSRKAKEISEKEAYGEMAADVADRMDNLARDFGRFNSAIQEVYKFDEFAVRARIKKKIQDLNDAKLDEKIKGGESNREKVAKAYEELEKMKKEFGEHVDREINRKMDEILEQLPKEHKSYAKKAVDALDKLEKDIMSGKIAFSSVIPPPVAVAIIRTAKILIKGGMLAHDAIKKAIEKHKAENPKDETDFTEAIPKFKDYLDQSGVKDSEVKAPRVSKKEISDLEALVKKVENDFKNPKPKKPGVEVSEAEKALTQGTKLPSDYAKEVARLNKEQDKIAAKLEKEINKEAAKALREDAKRVAKEKQILEEALKAFDGSVVKEAQLKVLNKIFPKKRMESAKKRQEIHEKIVEAFDNGALDNASFEKLFYDKFGLTDVNAEGIREQMDRFSERIHKAADGGLKEREYTAMLNFLEDRKKQNMAEWITTPFYANILSGYETHLNNAQFNLMSGIAQTALMAEKNPRNAKFLAMKMLSNFPAALTQGANVLMSGTKYGETAKPESLAERRADKGAGISHYYKLPGRMLQASDVIFNTPVKAMKRAELLLKIADNYNKSLPKEQQKTKEQIQADINDIMFDTTERKAQAMEQAKKDIIKLEGPDVDFNDRKIARDLKLRTFEIMEKSRPEDKYLQYGIDYDAVSEQAQNFANASLLQGKPVGSLGAVSTMLETIAAGLPISRFAVTTFINVPLNLANMMIDKSPIAFARMAAYEVNGRRGLFTTEEFAKRHGIKTELTPEERKEAYIRAANYSAALLGVAALTGLTYKDDEGKERPVLEITADGTGDYQKNKSLKFASGGDFKEYTADFMGFQFSYKYNSILSPIFTPLGSMSDFEKYKDKNPEEEKALYARLYYGLQSYGSFVLNQANLQGFRDLFGSQYNRPSVDLENDMQKNAEKLAKSGGKVLRGLLVPNFLIQGNKDVKGLMEMPDKKAVEWYDYMIKDIPLVESIMKNRYDHYGRDIKSEFHLPIIFVPDKLNLESKDPYYKMDIEHKYDPTFVKEKTVYDGEKEVNLTPGQMDEMNKIRGQYVREKLESKVKVDGKKTYMELLNDLSDKDYAEEKNRLFKDGELYAKSKIMGLDVEQELKEKRREDRKADSVRGKKKLSRLFQKFRDGQIK